MTEITVTLHGDWRIGTGAGVAGAVDEAVRRDADDLPVIPATTLTGLWRDGCERVAAALDAGNSERPWAGWVDMLFGSQPAIDGQYHRAPVPAALSVRTAQLGAAVREQLRADRRLATGLYAIRPGVALDPETHHVRDKHLRMVEVTRGGWALRAPFELADHTWNSDQRYTAMVLLTLGAEEITALGGGRRRGLGRCTVTLPEPDAAVRNLLDAEQPPVPATRPQPAIETPAVSTGTVDTDADWVTLRLRAVCVDPVLSEAVATDGVVRGLPFVPGSRLLPAVAARLRQVGVAVEALIDKQDLRCGPLVPEIGAEPARPMPRCLVAAKTAGPGSMLWNTLRGHPRTDQAAKPPRGAWLGESSAGEVAVVRPALETRMHNTVHDPVQRPSTDVGGLYSYQAIPAGTRLSGELRLRVPAGTVADVLAALEGQWTLGRSRKDDYGRARVTAEHLPQDSVSHQDSQQVTVWFLTDAVLLDDRLAPVSTVDGVLRALGLTLGHDLEHTAHAVTFGRTDGWHGRWGRPRPSLITVAAGSVLVVRRRDGEAIPAAALTSLQGDGLGERRAEGLGQIVVNDPLLAGESLRWAEPPAPTVEEFAPEQELTESERQFVDQLRRTVLRREIEHRAATLPRSVLGALAEAPPSQRGALRAALLAAVSAEDPTAVLTRFLDGLRLAAVRSTRWTKDAEATLRELMSPGGSWEVLEIAEGDRIDELEPWALQRVLAHLQAGGRSAASTMGAEDGA